MSNQKAREIIIDILSKPIENLTMKQKKMPNIEVLRLYR